MTEEFFLPQILRLRARFGQKAFDNEFSRLLASEMKDVSDQDFLTIVNRMLSERKHTNPPVMMDFREAKHRLSQGRFNAEVDRTATNLFWPAGSLGRALHEHYPGAKDLKEAMEIARLKQRIKKADDDAL